MMVFVQKGNMWTHKHVQREDDMKTQREDNHLPAKEKGLKQTHPSQPSGRTDPARHLDLGLLISSAVKQSISAV